MLANQTHHAPRLFTKQNSLPNAFAISILRSAKIPLIRMRQMPLLPRRTRPLRARELRTDLRLRSVLAELEDLLHDRDIIDDLVESVLHAVEHHVAVVFGAVLPDGVHERRVDLLKLFERTARCLSDEHLVECHQGGVAVLALRH
jgi:hypothetical protein